MAMPNSRFQSSRTPKGPCYPEAELYLGNLTRVSILKDPERSLLPGPLRGLVARTLRVSILKDPERSLLQRAPSQGSGSQLRERFARGSKSVHLLLLLLYCQNIDIASTSLSSLARGQAQEVHSSAPRKIFQSSAPKKGLLLRSATLLFQSSDLLDLLRYCFNPQIC